jgi:rSAM/selenodomain-associated transferase 2
LQLGWTNKRQLCWAGNGGRLKMNEKAAQVSIIVPVLNEAEAIRPFLKHLRNHAPDAEIVVVDGGSSDGTAALATELADLTLTTTANRAQQMNAGAGKSSGGILWFLHVDVQIPQDAISIIQRMMAEERVIGGFFRIRLPGSRWIYRLTDSVAHYLGLLLRMRCGDHGIFCRRGVFFHIGGYPKVPLMEDAEFFRSLLRNGKVCWTSRRLIVSPRRYEQIGAWRLTLFYGLIGGLYGVGVPLSTLARLYARLCQPQIR